MPESCPHCGYGPAFDDRGHFSRAHASKPLEGRGVVRTRQSWNVWFCPECHQEFATLEKTVRMQFDEDGEEVPEGRELVTDGGDPDMGIAAVSTAPVGRPPWDERVHAEEDLYRDASIKWGDEAQMAKAAEELAELSAVCARDLNGQADQQHFLEELVDARIMIEQLAQHITNEALEEMVDEKMEQLAERVDGGDDGGE